MKVTLAMFCAQPGAQPEQDNAEIKSEAVNAEIEDVAIESGRPGQRSRTRFCTN